MLQTIAGAILATRGAHELSPSNTGIIPHPVQKKVLGRLGTRLPYKAKPLHHEASSTGQSQLKMRPHCKYQVLGHLGPGPSGQPTHVLTW